VAALATRLIVAIDGTYVRSNLDTGLYQHCVVAGRIERDGILAGRFAWIARWPGEAEQLRWTMAGAHRLLQVRTRVLNQQLRHDFERWHLQLRATADPVRQAA
jgi:hypothetical protein